MEFCHRIPDKILRKIFHCTFVTLFAEIGDKIFTFLGFSVQKSVFFSTASSRATFFLWNLKMSDFWLILLIFTEQCF